MTRRAPHLRRRSSLTASLVTLAILAGACDGGGPDVDAAPVDSETTASDVTSSTVPPFDQESVATLAPLGLDDVPPGWEARSSATLGDLADVCPEVAAERDTADTAAASPPARSDFSARSALVGIPALRQQILVYADEASASAAFDVRAGGVYALCLAGVAGAVLDGSEARVQGKSFREVDPGDLGDDARAWVVAFTVEQGGVGIEGRFEIVTFRVGPLVSALLVTSSPAFPLTAEQRSGMLELAASRAAEAVASG